MTPGAALSNDWGRAAAGAIMLGPQISVNLMRNPNRGSLVALAPVPPAATAPTDRSGR
jgi:hypothetical protein